jgi:hypothetical protein
VNRQRLVFDLPPVLTPHTLLAAMMMIATAGVFDDDSWMHGAGVGLMIDALLVRLGVVLRER